MSAKVTASVFVGTSLDGFLARVDGAFDFLHGDGGGGPHGYEEFFATVDALVMGRNTFDIVRGFDQWPYGPKGITIQRFLAAGLIDRIIVTRVPVLIGTGIPLFGPLPRDVRLRHVATRDFAGGAVQSEYEVVR